MAGSMQRQKVYAQVDELCLLAKSPRADSIRQKAPRNGRQIDPRFTPVEARRAATADGHATPPTAGDDRSPALGEQVATSARVLDQRVRLPFHLGH